MGDKHHAGMLQRYVGVFCCGFVLPPMHSRRLAHVRAHGRAFCTRLLHTVFKRAAAKSDTVFTIMLTYVELYNNKVRDLLAPVSKPKHGQSRVELPRVTMHEVRGRVRLSGTETLRVPISNLDEALNLLRQYVGSVCCHILPGVEASPVQLCPIAAATRTAPWGAQTSIPIALAPMPF